jgi:aryl-alcohol dehydrogenase-like predicted oxidoreductase
MATDSAATPLVHASGTFELGGETTIHRLGYGAMQITGEGIFGEPKDPEECKRVLQRAVELGVDFIDTADSYGPEVSERLIGEALHPYAEGLVIATKAGLTRPGPSDWRPVGREGYLLQQLELSLRRLKVDRIDLWQLHRIDPATPQSEQFKVLREAQDSGKVKYVGLSEVSVGELEAALSAGVKVATVQNIYNLVNRTHEDVLDACEERGIGFIPWFPMAAGHLAADDGPLKAIADDHDATPSQLALAWLLKRSPVMLPIPGTSTVAHLEQNLAAATLELSDDEFAALDAAGKAAA